MGTEIGTFGAASKRILSLTETGTDFPAPVSLFLPLFTQTELSDDGTISFVILLCQIAEQIFSVANHFQQTALRMVILRILLHVLGQHVDAAGENSNLHFGRTGIVFTGSVVRDNLLFEFFFHRFSPFCDCVACIPLSQFAAGEIRRSRVLCPHTVVRYVCFHIRKQLYHYFSHL